MPRFSANISMLFADVAMLDRIDRAAAAGFRAVEIQFPYDHAVVELKERLLDKDVTLELINFPAGNWAAGDRGITCDPSRQDEFRASATMAIEYAIALGVPRINCLSGRRPSETEEDAVLGAFVENLDFAARACGKEGIDVLIEPINTHDIPGFWLDSVDKAQQVIDKIDAENVRLQFDIYHAQRSGGDIAAKLSETLDLIGHVQFADNPGRHEPGTGELNFEFLFGHLDRIGYTGWTGAEYVPAGKTEEGLGWMKMFGGEQ